MSDPYGVVLTKIDADGAAARAGLSVGDVVQSINSSRISNMDDIKSIVAQMSSGETASLTIWRDRELYEATLAF